MKVTQHTEEIKRLLDRVREAIDDDLPHVALFELDTIDLLLKDLTYVIKRHLSSQANHKGCEI